MPFSKTDARPMYVEQKRAIGSLYVVSKTEDGKTERATPAFFQPPLER